MTMLIIEGPDNLGKTTAAKRIVELITDWPVYYAHMSRPNQTFDFFHHYKSMMSPYAVQDRFHLGSLVWHEGIMYQSKLRIIEAWLQLQGSLTIIFYSGNRAWYLNRLNESQKDEMFNIDEIMEANEQYIKMMDGSHEEEPRYDFAFDVGSFGFPKDHVLEYWIKIWTSRLALCESKGLIK
jgi:hypothetical protein